MTREQFENLKVGDYFHEKNRNTEWVVIERRDDDLRCECTKNEISNNTLKWQIGNPTVWNLRDACIFTIGKHPDGNTQQPYHPAHDEICTVLTTQGLATKCRAFEHNGEFYAIPLKDDKPDGIFNPSQIEKFLKL